MTLLNLRSKPASRLDDKNATDGAYDRMELLKAFLVFGATCATIAAYGQLPVQSAEVVNLGDKFQSYRAALKAEKVAPQDIDKHVKIFKEHVIGDQSQFSFRAVDSMS